MDPSTGEILAEEGTNVTVELADKIQNAAVPFVWIQGEERKIKVLSSMMVDITAHVDLDCDPKELRCYRISILSCTRKDSGRK